MGSWLKRLMAKEARANADGAQHSCDNNVEFIMEAGSAQRRKTTIRRPDGTLHSGPTLTPVLGVKTKTRVQKGAELLVDYGSGYCEYDLQVRARLAGSRVDGSGSNVLMVPSWEQAYMVCS